MAHREAFYLTLADYQKFSHHPDPVILDWAVQCIGEQYPAQTAESFVHLLDGERTHLQIVAAQAIGRNNAIQFEPALRATRPASQGGVRNWFTVVLGQLQSQAIRAELIVVLEAIPPRPLPLEENGITWLFVHSAAEALGYYPDADAQAVLWRLLRRYPVDDRLIYQVTKSLLQHLRPAEIPGLVQRLAELKPSQSRNWSGWRAVAEMVQMAGLVGQLAEPLTAGWDQALEYLDFWFIEEIPFSSAFEESLEKAGEIAYAGIFPQMLSEFEGLAAKRQDNLTGWLGQWQAGHRPTGYPARMALTRQLLAALAAHPPQQPQSYLKAVALGLALLGQAAVDQDDAAALAAAPNEMFRQATLFSILGSRRPNVLPDIIDRVVALAPAVVPHLTQILREGKVWAWLRVLPAIERLARSYPGAADAAVPAILDLVHLNQSDEVLEAVSPALIAIGPGAVTAIGERLGQDYVYDIYVGGALAHIPTETSVAVWLGYISRKPGLDEIGRDYLADLGHPAGLAFLRDNFDWDDDPQLCMALYKLAVVTGYGGPEFEHWQTVARPNYPVTLSIEP